MSILNKKKGSHNTNNKVNIKTRATSKGETYEYWFAIPSAFGKRKRISKSGFHTKTEARAAGNAALQQYKNYGNVIDSTRVSFSDLVDKWIESLNYLKESTVRTYEKNARLYIKPALGNYTLNSLNNMIINDLIVNLYDKGISINTLSNISGNLSSIFKFAVCNRYLMSNPIVSIKIPRNRKPKKATKTNAHIYISKEWMRRIVNRFPEGTSAYLPIILGYSCGLRLGEAFALTWDDIDFEKKTITVNRQIQWCKCKDSNIHGQGGNRRKIIDAGYWFFDNPKYNSKRVVDILDDEFLTFLKSEKEHQQKSKEYYAEYYTYYYLDRDDAGRDYLTTRQTGQLINMLCVRENGEYISPNTMQHASSEIKKLGLTDFDFHSLRHTHTTELINQGAKPEFVQHRLGHKNIATTMDTYYHLTDATRCNQALGLTANF